MADGSLIFDTKLDSSGLKSGLSTVGGIATGAMKAVGVGVSIAAGAVAALTKASVDSYAAYEQLTGGVETLFGTGSLSLQEYANSVGGTVESVKDEYNSLMNAQQTVFDNASKAYKTAGMSANDYMETVTSFSASLISSLSGDTEKAASYADRAIVDMSDNANKMGSNIQDIQNAYQGFAKQNYTMLDNLKLGYGGTKAEMERLLEDASKLSGIEYDISSFADVTEAIHVIQTEMGITGTTAKEASTTIEGSLNSAKAAWENLLTGLADSDGDLDTLIDNFVQSVVTAGENLLPVIEQSIIGISSLIEQLFPQIASMLPDLVQQILPGLLSAGSDVIIALVTGIVNALPQLTPAALKIVMHLVNGLLPLLPQIIECGLQVIIQLALGIAQSLPDLIPTIVDVVLQIVETLIDNVDLLVDASIAIIIGLAEGLINALPRLIDKAPIIIEKLLIAFCGNAPKLAKAAIELLGVLGDGLISNIPKLISKIPQLLKILVEAFIGACGVIVKVGYYIVTGLWNGIKEKWDWLLGKVAGVANSIVDRVKDVLDIHSPSKKFGWIGKMCLEGFDKEFNDFDPYNSLNKSMKVNKTSLSMEYNAGIESEYGPYGTDYDRFGDSVVDAFVRAGVTIEVDKRPFGRIVRSYA